jgi:hypothetical protein
MPQQFEMVYDQLLKTFEGRLAEPREVFYVMEKLMQNVMDTGVPTSSKPDMLAVTNGSQPIIDEDRMTELISTAMDTINEGNRQHLISVEEARDNLEKLNALKHLANKIYGLMSTPFEKDFEKATEDGLFKNARTNKALRDIVKLLVSGYSTEKIDPDAEIDPYDKIDPKAEIDPIANLENLVKNLNKVKVATFKQWAKNTNVDLKEDIKTVAQEHKIRRKAAIAEAKEQEIEAIKQEKAAQKEAIRQEGRDRKEVQEGLDDIVKNIELTQKEAIKQEKLKLAQDEKDRKAAQKESERIMENEEIEKHNEERQKTIRKIVANEIASIQALFDNGVIQNDISMFDVEISKNPCDICNTRFIRGWKNEHNQTQQHKDNEKKQKQKKK